MGSQADKNKTEHTLKKKGYLKGHGGWVTSLAVGEEEIDGEKVEFLLSGSRDKTLIKWKLNERPADEDDVEWGRPQKMFTGHSHFVNEICLTGDVASASLPLGTALSASGMLPPARLSTSSLDTPKTFSPSLCPLTTVKSLPEVATTRSKSGTSRLSASTLLTRTAIPTPSPALDSTTPTSPLSASPPLGIRPSRFGTTPT